MISDFGFEKNGHLKKCWACQSCIMPRNFHNYVQRNLVHCRVYVFHIIYKECEKHFPGIEDISFFLEAMRHATLMKHCHTATGCSKIGNITSTQDPIPYQLHNTPDFHIEIQINKNKHALNVLYRN